MKFGRRSRSRHALLAELQERLSRFANQGDQQAVLSDDALHLAQQIRDANPSPVSDLEVLQAVGLLHWYRYLTLPQGQDQADLAAALQLLEPVYRAQPDAIPDQVRDHFDAIASPDGPEAIGRQATQLLEQAMSTSDRATLDAAIDLLEQAVSASPQNNLGRAGYLSYLGLALAARFGRTGDINDVNQAVTVGQEAVDIVSDDDPRRARILYTLSDALRARFEVRGDLQDLNRAVDVGRDAVDATSPDHPSRATILSNLGGALQSRFKRTGDLDDLDQAIIVDQNAVDVTRHDDPNRASILSNLGIALYSRFGRTGDLDDLDQAITVDRDALDITPHDHPSVAWYLSKLGLALRSRFERTGEFDDLDQAIIVDREAVDATAHDHPNRPTYLSNLGNALGTRFERTGDLDDLNQAITVGREAVDATPPDHPDRPSALSHLGLAQRSRFERTGDLDDLDQAITVGREALDATPPDHPDRPWGMANLGVALHSRFERTGRLDDLYQAIDLFREAVDATPPDHPDRGFVLSCLGVALHSRFERTRNSDDLELAVGLLRDAAGVLSGPVHRRAQAARGWGRLAVAAGRWGEAVEAFGVAVELAGLVAWRGLGRMDQEFQLSKLSGLGSEAAAACLRAGQPDRAVELFEQGRGVLFSHVLDTRTDLTDLQETHGPLADQFARWRDELDRGDQPHWTPRPAGELDPALATEAAARRRHAAVEFDRVVTEIRALPGFGSFLLPRPVDELLPVAVGEPVVLVNVAPLRCDALILTRDGVDVLPIPGIDPAGVIGQVNTFLEALFESRTPGLHDATHQKAAEARVAAVLGWLWDRIAGPVLDHLSYTTTPPEGAGWPRVWWCPSGPLSMLPLHAAGHHHLSAARPDAVIDRVISSSVPTVRALLQARHLPPQSGEARVLVVAMPHTPDQADLPGVQTEADAVNDLFPGRVDQLGLPDSPPATYETVTAALPGHAWVHFACHGASDMDNPSASHLLLADYQTHPLTVFDITHLRLERAELAFLSACTTARTGPSLPDEPIHLAAACLLAGYAHVIATLWPIADTDAAWLTGRFYTTLTTTPGRPTATAAVALHHATRQLRRLYRERPTHWASYTHSGP